MATALWFLFVHVCTFVGLCTTTKLYGNLLTARNIGSMKRTGREFVTKGIVSEADMEKVASRFVVVGKWVGGLKGIENGQFCISGDEDRSGLCVYVVCMCFVSRELFQFTTC